MFGLTVEKLIVIGIVAAIIIGPHRLPLYAEKLAHLIRSFRAFTEAMKIRAETELGVPLNTAEWNAQLHQYDPRHIVRQALAEDTGDPEPATRERWVIVGGSSGHPIRRRIVEPVPLEPDEETVADRRT